MSESETSTETAPQDGYMTWPLALSGPLRDTTCLWQDLDGVHCEPAPQVPPPTSILWAWNKNTLLRIRLDTDEAFVAVRARDTNADPVQTWAQNDGRVRQIRPAPGLTREQLLQTHWQQTQDDGLDHPNATTGSITFLSPSPPA